MKSILQPSFTLTQVSSTLFVGCAALLIIGLQPILLGATVDSGMLSMGGVGIVAMGEIAALGIGAALSNTLLPVSHYRLVTIVAALLVAALNMITSSATGDVEFMVLRAVAGFAEGALVWVASSVIVRAPTPDRLAAIFMVLQAFTQAAMAALLSAAIVPRSGWQGGFRALCAVALVCVLLTFFLPKRLVVLKALAVEKLGLSKATILPPAVAFLHMAALSALWAYLEPIALAVGLSVPDAHNLISEVLFMQFIAGVASVWLIRKIDVVLTLQTSSVILVTVLGSIAILPSGYTGTFMFLCATFGFIWLILMPFHLGLALRVDSLGRVAMLIPAAQLLGSAFGPLVASMVVTGDQASNVPVVSLSFAVGATVLVMVWGRQTAKPDYA